MYPVIFSLHYSNYIVAVLHTSALRLSEWYYIFHTVSRVATRADVLTSHAWSCILSTEFSFDYTVALLPRLRGILAVYSSYWGSLPVLGNWELMGADGPLSTVSRSPHHQCHPQYSESFSSSLSSSLPFPGPLISPPPTPPPPSPSLRAHTHRCCGKSVERDPT